MAPFLAKKNCKNGSTNKKTVISSISFKGKGAKMVDLSIIVV